MFRLYN